MIYLLTELTVSFTVVSKTEMQFKRGIGIAKTVSIYAMVQRVYKVLHRQFPVSAFACEAGQEPPLHSADDRELEEAGLLMPLGYLRTENNVNDGICQTLFMECSIQNIQRLQSYTLNCRAHGTERNGTG